MNNLIKSISTEFFPFLVYSTDENGIIQNVNEKVLENSGFSEHELIRTSIVNRIGFIKSNGWYNFIKLISDMKVFVFRTEHHHKNDATKKILCWAIINQRSSSTLIDFFITDDVFISEKTNDRNITIMLEAVFNSIQDPIGIINVNKEVLYYNVAALELFELTIGDALGRKSCEIIDKDHSDFDCSVNQVVKTGETYFKDLYYPKKNIWLEIRRYPVFGADGRVEKVIEHFRDITERKKTEESLNLAYSDLKKSEKNTRLSYFVIDRAGEAIVMINSKGNIVRVNDMVCTLWGIEREQLIGEFIDFFDRTISSLTWKKFFRAIKRTKVSIYETDTYHSSGNLIPVEVTSNFLDYFGEEYVVSFVKDVSERKKADKSLKLAMSEIQQLKDRLEAENLYLQDEIKLSHNFEEIVTIDFQLKKVLSNVEKVASTNSTVLISGETGTGKELIARAIHNISKRKDRPLVKVNCASLPATLIESELFGYERGAFTGALMQKIGRFELANKGTIFLDEIGELPIELQAKLLRVIQDGEFERLGNSKTIKVDVRIIAATNRNLMDEIKKGNFRSDLFYRLNVFPVFLPPLRERKQDIPLLVNQFIIKFSSKVGKNIKFVPHKTMRALINYNWPGNVRELENVIERAMITSNDETIQIVDWLIGTGDTEINNIPSLAENEKEYILKILKLTNHRIRGENGAAKILQIKPTTLEARMLKLGIKRQTISTILE